MNTKRFFVIVAVCMLASQPLLACGPKNPYPLSEPGNYEFGTRMNYQFIDTSRNNREVNLYVWYPAILAEGEESGRYNFDAEPNKSGAPYPVILLSAKGGISLGPHLASYGFVVVGVDGQDSEEHYGNWVIDFPLDQVFALEQIALNPLEGLDGMLNTDNTGATGYSFGGYTALALGGARIDPEYHLKKCEAAIPGNPLPEAWWIDYACNIEGGWDEFVNHAGQQITTSDDGLWQPLTDSRIRAVAPLVPEGAWLFGERGLADIDIPVMIIAATKDDINPYQLESVFLYENLPETEKSMISFIDQDHFMLTYDEAAPIIKHFLVAFFGYHLQGIEEYKDFTTEDFVSRQEGLAWGVYKE